MHELVEQFCGAWEDWDRRSGGGSLHLDTVMRYLGGSPPSRDPNSEEATTPSSGQPLLRFDDDVSYSVEDMRTTMGFLVSPVGVNAGFLISSLIRIVTSHLELTAEAYKESIEDLPDAGQIEELFQRYSSAGTLSPNAELALSGMADFLQNHLSNLPGRGRREFPLDAWREIMLPLLDTEGMRRELYEELDEDDM